MMNRRINDALRTTTSILESPDVEETSCFRAKKRNYSEFGITLEL